RTHLQPDDFGQLSEQSATPSLLLARIRGGVLNRFGEPIRSGQTRAMPSLENVAHDVFELAIAVLADDADGTLRTHHERRLDRLSDVGDPARISAPEDA